MFLFKIEAAVSIAQVEREVKKLLDKFFQEYKLPIPKIKIVDRPTSRWLGRDVYTPSLNKNNTTLEVQKSIINDEKTLNRVLAHELIHHFNFLAQYAHPDTGDEAWKKYLQLRRYGIKEDAHGKEFKEWAAKINAVMGADYVTEKSNSDYVIEDTKEFYLLIKPIHNEFGWAWSMRPSPEIKSIIQQKIMDGGKLFLSKDRKFLSGTRIKKYGGLSVPLKDDFKKELSDMYNSNKDIKPTWPKLIKTLNDLK